MGRLLPSSDEMDPPEQDPRVLGVDSDDADDIMSALSSETARNILAALHNNPAAPSDLTSEVDTSLQNIQYHLQNLNEAGLAEVVDTHYSEKGREMKVYAANDNPIILFGSEEQSENVQPALLELLGGVVLLGVLSVVVNYLIGTIQPVGQTGGVEMFKSPTRGTSQSMVDMITQWVATNPGIIFFLGGLTILGIISLYRYSR